MLTSMRQQIAVAVCLVSAAFAVLAFHQGWWSASTALMVVGGIWSCAASWCGHRFTLADLRRMQRPMSEVFKEAQRAKLPTNGWFANAINLAATLFIIGGFVTLVAGVF